MSFNRLNDLLRGVLIHLGLPQSDRGVARPAAGLPQAGYGTWNVTYRNPPTDATQTFSFDKGNP